MEEKTRHRAKFSRIAAGFIIWLIVTAVFSLAIGAPVMAVWNWIAPEIFGLPAIGYWQAFGIVLLAKLVFGGFGSHFVPHPGIREEYVRDCGKRFWRRRAHFEKAFRDFGLDDDYEDWWEKHGSKSFDEYMKQKRGEKEK